VRVITNTAVSLDGRIATARYDHVAIGTPVDRMYMSVLRARADAVLVGGQTFRNWPLPLVPDQDAIRRLRALGFSDVDVPEPRASWLNVVLSRKLDLPKEGRFYTDPRVRPLFFTPAEGDMPGEVVRGEVTPAGVVAELERRGVQTLLIEAGGALIFEFLDAGLVDEMFVTLCPVLLGGVGAPSLVDGAGFSALTMKKLRLKRSFVWGDEVYLRYGVG
jgi:5-amino-6-(5-phosphoribosylamino)uracil reductase